MKPNRNRLMLGALIAALLVAGAGGIFHHHAGVAPATAVLAGALIFTGWRAGRRERNAAEREADRERIAVLERFSLLMKQANDAIVLLDDRMRITEANERAADLYGYPLPQLLTLGVLDLRAEAARGGVEADHARLNRDGSSTFETVHRRRDGSEFPVEVSARAIEADGRRHYLSVIRDISARKRHADEIERLNRLLVVISQVNQALVRAKTQQELFDDVCRVLVDVGRFRMAWVGMLEPETKSIVPASVRGDDTGYVANLHISADPETPEGRGPSGTAFREGRTLVVNDFFGDPSTAPWRERAAASGFHSSASFLLRRGGRPCGLLVVYAVERGFFAPKEVELLDETAGDISFALDVFANDARRRQAESQVLASERRLHFLMSTTPAIIYSLRAGGDFGTTFISPNVRRTLGYDAKAVLEDATFWHRHLHPDDRAAADQAFASQRSSEVISREYRFRHADGSWRWMHDEMRPVRDPQGDIQEYVGYWLDVTSRKQAEDALRIREELYSAIVNQAADAIALYDPAKGRFTEFNRVAHEGLGYTREQFAELGVLDIQAEHSPETIQGNIAKASEGPITFESRHRHRDGSLRDVRVSVCSIRLRGRPYLTAIWVDITESKRMARELENQQRFVSDLFEYNALQIVVKDLDGRYRLVNEAFERIVGRKRAELIGRTDLEIFPGATGEEFRRRDELVISTGESRTFDETMPGPSGERRHLLSTKFPVRNAGGEITGTCAMRMDITESRRAEEQLRILSRAIEQSPASIVITDLSGAMTYVNPTFLEVTGYTREEVLGQNPRVLKSGRTGPEVYAQMWNTLVRGEVWRGQLVNRKKNGDIYYERAVIAPVADESGKVTHYVALKEDVTVQHRTEEALRQTQQRFSMELEHQVVARTEEIRALMQSIPDTVLHLRTDGTVLGVQRAKDALAGRLVKDERGPDLGACLHPSLHAPVLEMGAGVLSEVETPVREVTIPGADEAGGGRARTFEIRAAPVRKDEFVVFIRDITTRKKLEADAANMLEKERQVSEMKSRFISVTSHEFRTPMAAARGSAELLHNHFGRLTAEKREELFQRIFVSMQRMTDMLDDVLTLSRMEAGRLGPLSEPVDLVQLVGGLIEEVRLADQDAHRVDYQRPDGALRVQSDPGLLHHILANLLSNAVRYSPPGSAVTVRVAGTGESAEISVEDEGIGIPEKDLHRIFEPFERGSNVGNIKGTGLGLNIVKRMTEILGGSVSVKSSVEKGTRFTVVLPHGGRAPS